MELGRVRWQLMVCDESHRIKNPTAQTTKAIYAMDAKIRIALSGTPVQNSLRDLWSQFDWLSSGFLGDLTSFTKRYEGRKIVGQPEERNRRLTALKEQINPRVLRRLKETTDGLDIPPKHIEKIELPLNERQVSLYNQIHTDFRRGDIQSMSAMMSLFKVCASPSTLTGLQVDASDLGPKMNWLVKKVLEIKSKGEKVVIFAEWYTVQDAIATVLSQALGEFVDRINGKVETALRLAKVDSFNRGTHGTVLVLGPKAAGVGLNITGANHVIHFTRHWNPALEAQATDRVHRIGQKRDVTVYLPVMTHPHLKTIELHLDALLQAKQGLAKDILMGVEQMSVQTQLERAMEAEPSSL
jgi:SNF2 family DNA or RNA helicase